MSIISYFASPLLFCCFAELYKSSTKSVSVLFHTQVGFSGERVFRIHEKVAGRNVRARFFIDFLSSNFAINKNGTRFPLQMISYAFWRWGLVDFFYRVNIWVVPLLAAGITMQVSRRRERVAAEDSSWIIEHWSGASHCCDERKGENLRQRHGWRKYVIVTRVIEQNYEQSEVNALIDLKVIIDFLFKVFQSRRFFRK